MARKNTNESPSLSKLLISREEAKEQIKLQIEKGQDILEMDILHNAVLKEADDKYKKWKDYTRELLLRSFDNESIADEFSHSIPAIIANVMATTRDRLNLLVTKMNSAIQKLESIWERLDLIPESNRISEQEPEYKKQQLLPNKNVFVVHGHDEATKQTVARFLEKLNLKPIILHEQPNRGRTIIEKFEDYSDVSFAVVILTPDDVGYLKDKPKDAKPRPRQNVILELGFFLGKLGRERVCSLYIGDIELPSDYDGVVYVAMDPSDGWKLKLAGEIKAAGIDVDLNRAL